MDGAKEQTIGDFRRKCREAGCHIRQTEPHSPWMNMAEIGVRELRCSRSIRPSDNGTIAVHFDVAVDAVSVTMQYKTD
jgi:hypothetical protein